MIASSPGKIDAGIATVAVSSPFWLRWIEEISTVATLVLPILGAILVLLRIWTTYREFKNRKDR